MVLGGAPVAPAMGWKASTTAFGACGFGMLPDFDVGIAVEFEFPTMVREAVRDGVGEVTVVVANGWECAFPEVSRLVITVYIRLLAN